MSTPHSHDMPAPALNRTDIPPVLCGGDIELGNFILSGQRNTMTCSEAARLLLAQIQGVAHSYAFSGSTASTHAQSTCDVSEYYGGDGGWRRQVYGSGAGYSSSGCSRQEAGAINSQDWGRKFLPCNGGCIYIDLGHIEMCLPEVLSATDHLAARHAMLRIVRDAQQKANARLDDGRQIQVLVNNSDGHGNSYGSHLNFLVSRRAFNNLIHRKPHQMLYLATFQASSIIFTGSGKVGSENNRPPVDFQLSQRADFFESVSGLPTTFFRPLVNTRDETLCGDRAQGDDGSPARLHVIFFDSTLCHVSSLLAVGVMQIMLAMIQRGWIQLGLLLDDPLLALLQWSHDPSLRRKARLACGKDYTAIEVQMALADLAGRFIASGKADGIVPEAAMIHSLWTQTLQELRDRDMTRLSGKLDWALKYSILEQAVRKNGFGWDSPQLKHLDQMYANLNPGDGLYWAMERAGAVQKLVSDERVERFVHEPPADTRAFTRAQVLRNVGTRSVITVDWDEVRIKLPGREGAYWPGSRYYTLPMHDPLKFTRQEFDQAASRGGDFLDALQRLGMSETTYYGQPVGGGASSSQIVLADGLSPRRPLSST